MKINQAGEHLQKSIYCIKLLSAALGKILVL
jgi:hypothetical protein